MVCCCDDCFGLELVLIRVKIDGTFMLGLTLFLILTLTIPNLNLTYFGVPPVKSDMIVAGEEYANEYLPYEYVFDKQSCQIKREKNLFTSKCGKIINEAWLRCLLPL